MYLPTAHQGFVSHFKAPVKTSVGEGGLIFFFYFEEKMKKQGGHVPNEVSGL